MSSAIDTFPAPQRSMSLFAQRHIRVFVSSTFTDMHAEREELVKRTFPKLRRLCEERGVTWTDIDLRWGVTDEQIAHGYMLPICLAEIDRCRPFFIGLLGERYGTAIGKVAPGVLTSYPWLTGYREHSLTEVEIQHGVLRNPERAEHAFFYLRDPAYLKRLPPDANPADFRCSTDREAKRLRQLKKRLRAGRFEVHENYPDPAALGHLVLTDFTALINRIYPEGSQPSIWIARLWTTTPLQRPALASTYVATNISTVLMRTPREPDPR